MDTVWIRLTLTNSHVLVNNVEQPLTDKSEYFMFGPTGVVRFHTRDGKTSLLNSGSVCIGSVTEDSEHIMDILRKMRGTVGRLNAKQKQKKTSKRKTSKR